jgi:hypothetical protein
MHAKDKINELDAMSLVPEEENKVLLQQIQILPKGLSGKVSVEISETEFFHQMKVKILAYQCKCAIVIVMTI